MASYLLDTCTFLWMTLEPEKLSGQAADICADPAQALFLSAVSVWEIEIKHRLGRLELMEDPTEEFIPTQRAAFEVYTLSFDEPASLRQPTLPSIHRDPFDRMLVCQAMEHGLTILTPDRHIASYPVTVAW